MADSVDEVKKIVYPEPPDSLKRGLSWRSLSYFGAGAIMASVTIGSGETLFASQAGALFGYGLIWCFVFGTIMKGVQVYTAARYFTLTGTHPMTHWGLLPGPRNWVPWMMAILSLACFPFWLAGLPMMIGQTLNWIFGVDMNVLGMSVAEFKMAMASMTEGSAAHAELSGKYGKLMNLTRLWGTVAIVMAVTFTWLQSLKTLETIQTVIVGVLLVCMLAACIAIRPDWFGIVAGMVPQVPAYPDWLPEKYPNMVETTEWARVAICLGAIGGGTYDYLGYIGCFRDKAWGLIGRAPNAESAKELEIATDDANLERARIWLIPAKIDVGVGFLVLLIFTICFIVLGAVILHADQAVPDKFELLSKQSRFLTEFSPALLYVYQLGIFMAFFGTIYGAYEIYLRTAYECLAPVSQKVREMPERQFRVIILAYCAVGGLTLLWFGGDDAMNLVAPAAIVGGVFTCGLWCFAMIWVERRFLPPALRMSKLLLVINWITGVFFTSMGAKAIWDYVGKLTG